MKKKIDDSDQEWKPAKHQMQLRPLVGGKSKPKHFAVADIEVREWVNFLVVGYYDGVDVTNFTCLTEFMAWLFSNDVPETIYAHFGAIFDFQFIIGEIVALPALKIENMIPRGTGILCFDVTDGNKTITFSDSSAFLPFSLRSLCESFKVEHQKLDVDYSRITKVTPKLLTYLKHDLMGLYECIEKFQHWDLIAKAGPKITMASQAVQVLRLFLDAPIQSLDTEDIEGVLSPDSFVRKSYFGGRTEIFKPLYEGPKKLKLYDVNSLYPTVMRENNFPNRFMGVRTTYTTTSMGFFRVKVHVPKSLKIPPLGTVLKVKNKKGEKNEKFVFPTGTFKGVWSNIELEYAKTLGVKILECYEGYMFEDGGPIFAEFIDTLYAMRLKAKQEKDTVTDLIAKLLMNSCYGRMGLNKDRERLEFDNGQIFDEEHSVIHTRIGDVRLVTEDITLEESFSNVAIAAWTTSLARIHMHKIYMQCADTLYYTDTDSIFTTKDFPEGDKLGELKLEYTARNACFLLPKTYLIEDMLNYSVWSATFFPRKKATITFKRGASFTVWGLPLVIADASKDKIRVLANDSDDNILSALEASKWTEVTGLPVPGIDDVQICRSENKIEIAVRTRGVLVLWLLHKKVVMKGFDRKKIKNFQLDDFAFALEGEARMHAPGMGPKPLFVDIAPKFATFKTAVRKGKMVTMTDRTFREIKASYDKRKIIKRDGLYDTVPLNMKDEDLPSQSELTHTGSLKAKHKKLGPVMRATSLA